MSPQDRPPALTLMRNMGLEPDLWQVEVLEGQDRRTLLNCCRQAGKSTVVAVLALAHAIFHYGAMVVIVSRSYRQSRELFRKATRLYNILGQPFKQSLNADELELETGSRIACLPCKEETIRCYSGVTLLIIDEASRVPDDIYDAVRPMLVASGGRVICLSTPNGKNGFFYDAWTKGGSDWHRIKITADQVARLDRNELDAFRRERGEAVYNQEFMCEFGSVEGLVFPNFDRCVVTEVPNHIFLDPNPLTSAKRGQQLIPSSMQSSRRHGGVDFGYGSPTVAIWGSLDHDGILWITGEHYLKNATCNVHARFMPTDVRWYSDPSGAAHRAEYLKANFKMFKGYADRDFGISAIAARLEDGSLRVVEDRCPNLLREVEHYRWSTAVANSDPERIQDKGDHAIDALRYLIATLDRGKLIRPRRLAQVSIITTSEEPTVDAVQQEPARPTLAPLPANHPFGSLPNLWRQWYEDNV